MSALEELKAALQEAKTEAATLRIRVRELEVKLVDVAVASERENTSLRVAVESMATALRGAAGRLRIIAKEDFEDGGRDSTATLVHVWAMEADRAVPVDLLIDVLAKSLPASDKSTFRQPAGAAGCKPEGLVVHRPDPEGLPPRSPCQVPSSITGAACLLDEGHPPDSPNRFHRYPAKES